MRNRSIAVIGGAGGIGRPLAARLAAEGARVVVLDLPASLERYPPPAESIPVDVLSESSVEAAAGRLAALEKPLDGVVNLAGFNPALTPLTETSTATFDEVVSGNLRGAFLSARAILPLMAEGSSLVTVSSGLARHARPGYGAYAAAKAGLIALTKTFALEAAPRVRVNAVAPGLVDTAFLRGGTGRSDEAGAITVDLAAYTAAIPLRRVAIPEDVVGPMMFLLGPDSAYMTGQVLWINGGAYMP